MAVLRLILCLHHHQPLGQLESALEHAYETRYRPFLDVMASRGEVRFALHTSGPLMEWLQDRHPDYVDRLRQLVETGQVEILGGGRFEPILTMIPHRDRVAQVRTFTEYLQELFPTKIRGIWLPERVWDQSVVSALVEAGIDYTILGESHFENGLPESDGRIGYYLTEEQGRLLKVFPACRMMRDGVAFADPQPCIDLLRSVADRAPGSTVVFADDGEKFGGWSNTSERTDRRKWLERFCDMLLVHRDWLELATFATAADQSLPLGRVYPSESSSRWRNSQARSLESDEIYSRMLGISERLAAVESNADSDPDYLEMAREELYRGQCHDAYGHGGPGGLNLPCLRNTVYRRLIAADNALDDAEGRLGPRVRAEAGDFNLDARQEVRLENDRLIALVRPALGGHVYELDVREPLINVLATLEARLEIDLMTSAGQRVHGRHPRKALVDHFYPIEATLADVTAGRDIECGDFALGTYRSRIRRELNRVSLIMDRVGRAGSHSVRLRKTIALSPGIRAMSVDYEIEGIPPGACLHFAVEINLALHCRRRSCR